MKNCLHEDEIPVDISLVRRLVDNQFPQYANLPLHKFGATGSTNIQFRLGADLLVRLPRQPNSRATIEKELHWTPIIGKHLPVAVPQFVGVGEPALGYSEPWLIVRWLAGDHPTVCNSAETNAEQQSQLAADLAETILALRDIDLPTNALDDPRLKNYRGRALEYYDQQMRRNIDACRSIEGLDLDLDAALAIWEDALKYPSSSESRSDTWYHSDLVAENLLLTNGRLTGLLDFGALAIGDPTIDLHGAWELFDRPAREIFRLKMGATDGEWVRGRAWALAVALMTFPYYWNMLPGRINDRLAMARSVLAESRGQSKSSLKSD